MTVLMFTAVLPWLLLAAGTWIGYQLVRQNGRILLRLESIETRVGPRNESQPPRPGGLPKGSPAPDFALPDLLGARHKLAEFRGLDLLLIFFNPQCGFCTRMAADLAALPAEGGDGRPVPILVTTGDFDENRKLVEQYGIRCVVLRQEEMEVAARYQVRGTPMGYRIDGAGLIASELAVGAEPLLKLAAAMDAPSHEPNSLANAAASPNGKDYRSLAASRLNRNGLKAGTPAPEFRLPRIDGGELALSDFRGERVLLVFSDPDCGPCDALAPRLQEVHTQRSDLQVLVVGRRELEANRAKADKLGLSYPVVVQKQWEVSLLYAMFATPIGYLIDERGILASDVAIGIEPILALAQETVSTVIVEEPAWAG
jgi:peroxiredoxin